MLITKATSFSQATGIEPGIYYDMPADVYHADPAISSSGLKTLLKSPLKFWHGSSMNPKREPLDNATLKNSRAFHTMLLEPEKFNSEFSVKAGCKTSSIAGVVGEGDYNRMVEAANYIRNHARLSQFISGGQAEVSIFWRDPDTGLMCRVRYDYLLHWVGFDYKTTTDISSKAKLGYAIRDYGYDVSAAMYIEGFKTTPMYNAADHNGFTLLFQEKESPCVARAINLTELVLARGHAGFRRGLQLYQQNMAIFGNTPWSAGYDEVEDMLLDDMPFDYRNSDAA